MSVAAVLRNTPPEDVYLSYTPSGTIVYNAHIIPLRSRGYFPQDDDSGDLVLLADYDDDSLRGVYQAGIRKYLLDSAMASKTVFLFCRRLRKPHRRFRDPCRSILLTDMSAMRFMI